MPRNVITVKCRIVKCIYPVTSTVLSRKRSCSSVTEPLIKSKTRFVGPISEFLPFYSSILDVVVFLSQPLSAAKLHDESYVILFHEYRQNTCVKNELIEESLPESFPAKFMKTNDGTRRATELS